MEDMVFYDKLREVPEDAKKPIKGGKLNGFTDINPMWRIEKLTEVFGPCGFGWFYEIKDQRLQEGANGEVKAFVDINLYIKDGDTVSMPIPGIGGSSFIAIEKGKPVTSDECFKMALTDAIGVAAKALGLGADVYRGCDKSKYNYMGDPGDQMPQPQGYSYPQGGQAPQQPPQRPQGQLPPLPQPQQTPPPPPQQTPPPPPQQAPRQAPRQQMPPPDVTCEPKEAPDGYYYCDNCKQIISGWRGTSGRSLSPKEVAVRSMTDFAGRQLCLSCYQQFKGTAGR